ADGRLELIVAEEHLDLAAQHAAVRVDLLHGQDRAALLVGGDGAERPRQREGESDLDGPGTLSPQDGGKPEGGGAESGRRQKCASLHTWPPCQGGGPRRRRGTAGRRNYIRTAERLAIPPGSTQRLLDSTWP